MTPAPPRLCHVYVLHGVQLRHPAMHLVLDLSPVRSARYAGDHRSQGTLWALARLAGGWPRQEIG